MAELNRGFVASLLLVGAMAGCIGGDDADDAPIDEASADTGETQDVDTVEPETQPEPQPSPVEPDPVEVPAPPRPPALPPPPPALSFTDCSEILGVFPLPMDMVAGLLPEGFAPAPFLPAEAPVQPLATLAVVGFSCGNATGPAVLDTAVAELHAGIAVVPPPEYVSDGVSIYLVPLAVLTGSSQVFALYQSWAVPGAGSGAATVANFLAPTPPEAPVAVRTGQIEIIADALRLRLTTAVEGPVETQSAGTARAFLVSGSGTFDHVIDFSWTESSTIAQGEAMLDMDPQAILAPFPLPVAPGIAIHNFDRGYAITLTYLSVGQLPPPPASEGEGAGVPRVLPEQTVK